MVKGMKTHEFLAAPGDALTPARDVDELHGRLEEMSLLTGLPPNRMVLSYLSSVPIPRYETLPEGESRWAGLKAEALKSPLFLLPENVHDRYPVADGEGGQRLETDDEWALRICLLVISTGLYDPTTGQWRDILASLGYDLDDESVRARIQDWMNGAEDPELEALDLDAQFPDTDELIRVYDVAQEAFPGMFALSRWITFRGISEMIDRTQADHDQLTFEDVLEQMRYVVVLARHAARPLGDVDLDELIDDAESNIEVSRTTEELIGFAIVELDQALEEVIARFEPEAMKLVDAGVEALEGASPDLRDASEQTSAPEQSPAPEAAPSPERPTV
ncbi:hypothetical protein Bequi_13480 [Brachybacterium sp. JHP9]|uniref:Uncharacterized protein n=1 Tax=Brachybacterium equifaecis TaxID=2910770 RepID=A0ABT0R3A5_9MICO|nr:hypothetical protein [Brachybacterium equifaecis]MCL6424376.1 hypothetical protein [Brachybacterium equifaecis]